MPPREPTNWLEEATLVESTYLTRMQEIAHLLNGLVDQPEIEAWRWNVNECVKRTRKAIEELESGTRRVFRGARNDAMANNPRLTWLDRYHLRKDVYEADLFRASQNFAMRNGWNDADINSMLDGYVFAWVRQDRSFPDSRFITALGFQRNSGVSHKDAEFRVGLMPAGPKQQLLHTYLDARTFLAMQMCFWSPNPAYDLIPQAREYAARASRESVRVAFTAVTDWAVYRDTKRQLASGYARDPIPLAARASTPYEQTTIAQLFGVSEAMLNVRPDWHKYMSARRQRQEANDQRRSSEPRDSEDKTRRGFNNGAKAAGSQFQGSGSGPGANAESPRATSKSQTFPTISDEEVQIRFNELTRYMNARDQRALRSDFSARQIVEVAITMENLPLTRSGRDTAAQKHFHDKIKLGNASKEDVENIQIFNILRSYMTLGQTHEDASEFVR